MKSFEVIPYEQDHSIQIRIRLFNQVFKGQPALPTSPRIAGRGDYEVQ